METKELEKMAYLYLCSPKDREKIGFPAFALAFFNRYAENFQVQESVLEKIHDGWDKDLYCDTEYYLEERARWVSSFLEGVPSMVRKEVREYVKSHDDSWEVYEEIMERLHLPC